jgi:hypothetical protein
MTRTFLRIFVVEVYDKNSRNGENFTLIESGTIMSQNDILRNTNLAVYCEKTQDLYDENFNVLTRTRAESQVTFRYAKKRAVRQLLREGLTFAPISARVLIIS